MACRPGWGGTFLLWGILSSLIAMFTFGNIAPVASAMFLNVNIAQRKQQERAYSKYWNLFVEKAKVTVKPLPGSEAAVTSMPILEHRRATR